MQRCSWPIWVVSIAGLTIWVAWAIFTYRALLLPDFPVRIDGKNFIHTPRSDALLGAFMFGSLYALGTSFFACLIVLFSNQRWSCIAAMSFAPLFLVWEVLLMKFPTLKNVVISIL